MTSEQVHFHSSICKIITKEGGWNPYFHKQILVVHVLIAFAPAICGVSAHNGCRLLQAAHSAQRVSSSCYPSQEGTIVWLSDSILFPDVLLANINLQTKNSQQQSADKQVDSRKTYKYIQSGERHTIYLQINEATDSSLSSSVKYCTFFYPHAIMPRQQII